MTPIDTNVPLVVQLVRMLEQAERDGVVKLNRALGASGLVEFVEKELGGVKDAAAEAMRANRLVTQREVADLLRVPERDIPRLVKDGMPCITLPGEKRPIRKFFLSEVLDWARTKKT